MTRHPTPGAVETAKDRGGGVHLRLPHDRGLQGDVRVRRRPGGPSTRGRSTPSAMSIGCSRRRTRRSSRPTATRRTRCCQMDLRAEPIVLCVPAVEKKRYYSVQLTDMYSFNYGYIGSRATGNERGLLHGRRARLEGRDAGGHREGVPLRDAVRPRHLSARSSSTRRHAERDEGPGRLPRPAALGVPEAAGAAGAAGDRRCRSSPRAAFKTDFPAYLNFLLQFCPAGAGGGRRCARGSRRSASRPASPSRSTVAHGRRQGGVGLGHQGGLREDREAAATGSARR